VIDECHVVLNEQRNFRRQMQQLRDLVNVKTQMVLLTTTLPPSKEKELWRRMSFKETKVMLFRARTVRKNVKYQVVKVKGDDQEEEEEFIVQMVQRVMRGYAGGKSVVYCNSVRKVKKLAEALNCEGYYHHAEQKDEKLKRFRDGEKRMIVATSALGLGIDIPDIRAIIHADEPRSLLDYAQESERAGRDELSSQVIVIWKEDGREAMSAEGWRIEEMGWVTRFIKGDEDDMKASCRRVVLDEYLDGRKDRRRCEEGEEQCDVCNEMMGLNEEEIVEDAVQEKERRSSTQDESGLNLMERQEYNSQQHERLSIRVGRNEQKREEGEEAEELLRELEKMKGLCPVCTENGSWSNVHPIFYCQESDDAVAEYQTMKKLIRECKMMKDFEGCTWCFVPQAWCNRWEENEEEEGGWRLKVKETKCKYTDMVLSWFLVFVQNASFAEGLQDRMSERGLNIKDQKEVLRYLGRRKK